MYVRDAAINRVFLGPRAILQAGPLLQVAGQIPVLIRSAPPTPPSAASPASTSMSVSSPQAGDGNAASSATAPAKIPRPPNAFIIYRKSHHADTVAQNPGLHNNQICKFILYHPVLITSDLSQPSSLAQSGMQSPRKLGQTSRLRRKS